MKQVLINLIGNALKFTERGEVVVTIRCRCRGNAAQPRRCATPASAFHADRLDAIFNVFEQAESMTARRFGGTGLGLAISRSLCELMGHRLDVESEENVGTTMVIRLGTAPRSSRRSVPGMLAIPDPKVAPAESKAVNTDAPLVLVVDADEDARLLLAQHLEEAGCRVANADSGVDALQMARDLLPDMIFLDLRLPKISGFDVFRILKSDDMLKDTPVVIASVAGSEARPGLAGAAAILDKPISRQIAIDLVRRWLPGAVA